MRKSAEWLATHRATIGGSNAAASVGLNKHKTPAALYYEMVEGRSEDLENNADALRGILLEPVARQRLSDVLGMDVIEHNQDDFLRNEKYQYAHALPDGWIVFEGERIPIEIKVPRPENWRRLDEEIPDAIQCQAVHNAAVIGAPALMLACMCPVTLQLFRQLYEPRQYAIDVLMEAEASFYENHIVQRVPPSPQTNEDLRLLWPEAAAGTRIHATQEIYGDMISLVAAKASEKAAQFEIENLSLRIKSFMRTNEALIGDGGKIVATYGSHLATALDSKLLKRELPEIWNKFAREKLVRVFLAKSKNIIL